MRESYSSAELEWPDDRTRARHLGAADDGSSPAAESRVSFQLVPVEPIDASTAPVPAGTAVIQSGSKASDPVLLKAAPGGYRLEVAAANCEWTVSVWDRD